MLRLAVRNLLDPEVTDVFYVGVVGEPAGPENVGERAQGGEFVEFGLAVPVFLGGVFGAFEVLGEHGFTPSVGKIVSRTKGVGKTYLRLCGSLLLRNGRRLPVVLVRITRDRVQWGRDSPYTSSCSPLRQQYTSVS
jgi:hypothetical protein